MNGPLADAALYVNFVMEYTYFQKIVIDKLLSKQVFVECVVHATTLH